MRGGEALESCLLAVAQGLPVSSHPSVFVPAVFGCRQGAAVGVCAQIASVRWGMPGHQLMA